MLKLVLFLTQKTISSCADHPCVLLSLGGYQILMDCPLITSTTHPAKCRTSLALIHWPSIDLVLCGSYFHNKGVASLYRTGFKGRIIATLPTLEFLKIAMQELAQSYAQQACVSSTMKHDLPFDEFDVAMTVINQIYYNETIVP